MYQPQPRMASTGNGIQQPQFQATSVNTQFPASYNNQVSNYNPQHWNQNTFSGQQNAQSFAGYPNSGTNNPDFSQQHWQQQNGTHWNPGWQNSQVQPVKSANPTGNNQVNQPTQASCDNYQRTFDYVQECQNWTTQ